jgi:hypothetical protein
VGHATRHHKALAVLRRSRKRERAHRAAVERVVECDDTHAFRLTETEKMVPRELEHGLVSFGARVAEECAVHLGATTKLVREKHVRLVVEIVRRVHEGCGLLRDHTHKRRMGVTDRANSNTRAEIEPSLVVHVVELAPDSTRENELRGLIVAIEAPLRDGENFGIRRHGSPTLRCGARGLETTRALLYRAE